jgi:hypothetical protein
MFSPEHCSPPGSALATPDERRRGGGVSRTGLAALALATLALSGCETTAEKSAELQQRAKRVTLDEKGLSIARQSTDVKVLQATIVRGSEEAAAVVTLHNRSSHTLRGVPLAITVKDGGGRTLFQNNGPGLQAALVSVASLGPHRTLTWVDDQLPVGGAPTSVSARVGQARKLSGNPPTLRIDGVHLSEDPSNGLVASGVVANRSAIAQTSLVVFGVARRGGRVVAAGRGVLPRLAAGASAPFEVFLVGNAWRPVAGQRAANQLRPAPGAAEAAVTAAGQRTPNPSSSSLGPRYCRHGDATYPGRQSVRAVHFVAHLSLKTARALRRRSRVSCLAIAPATWLSVLW